jgi:hypothetical protein
MVVFKLFLKKADIANRPKYTEQWFNGISSCSQAVVPATGTMLP